MDNRCFMIAILLFFLVYVPCIIIMGFLLHSISKSLNATLKFEENKFNFLLSPGEHDFDILDNMIQDELELYVIKETELKGNSDIYMSKEKQEDARRIILTNVLKKISPIHLSRLKYIYNPDIIEDIIFEKVQSAVILFSADNNSGFVDEK